MMGDMAAVAGLLRECSLFRSAVGVVALALEGMWTGLRERSEDESGRL